MQQAPEIYPLTADFPINLIDENLLTDDLNTLSPLFPLVSPLIIFPLENGLLEEYPYENVDPSITNTMIASSEERAVATAEGVGMETALDVDATVVNFTGLFAGEMEAEMVGDTEVVARAGGAAGIGDTVVIVGADLMVCIGIYISYAHSI